MSSSTHAAVAAADSSSPKRAELAVSAAGGGGGGANARAAAAAAKPRGSSYDADELNEIRNLSLGNDEGAAGAGFKRGRRGSGGRKFEKERVTLLFIF